MTKSNINKTALQEVPGVSAPKSISVLGKQAIQKLRKQTLTAETVIDGILSGNITALSRSITLIESSNPSHFEAANKIINTCLTQAKPSIRIGITGVPGVGKSTFIEAFGKHLTHLGHKVAVLAVDPSSTLSHGSILGDKTRMEELVKDPNAYIRPSASGETLGGVARKTRETIILCEAFGFDTILIETVGVGQSETAVHSMVDFFLLLKITGAGDELQGIKRGVMEMADAVIINKADGDNQKKSRITQLEFQRALHLFPQKKSGWTPTTHICSSITKDGIPEIWETIQKYFAFTKENGYFIEKRKEQNQFWMKETIDSALKNHFYNDVQIISLLKEIQDKVAQNALSPFSAAQQLLELYFERQAKD